MTTPSVHVNAVEIPVGDLKRAVAWYQAALGLACTWSDERHAMLSGSSVTGGGGGARDAGVQILLVQTTDPARLTFRNSWNGVHHSVLDFRTEDLEGLHAHLKAQGTRVDDLNPPVNDWAPRGFAFLDSEGNRLGAFSYAG